MTEMTEATASATPSQPAKSPSFWEDCIEIFVHPADVYRRRANASAWPPFLFVVIVMGVLTFATFNLTQPIFEGEMARNMAKAAAKNPQLTPEILEKQKQMGLMVGKYVFPLGIALAIFLVGVATWLVSKIVSAKTTFGQAIVIASWAYFPRVLGAILTPIQGLIMDPAKMTSAGSVSLSPARFMDPDTANQFLYQLSMRFDLLVIWETILLAIGVYVTGKITKNQAAVFGVLIWLIGGLWALRQGYMMS